MPLKDSVWPLVARAVALDDVSLELLFLERFDPGLLSFALFVQAARPISGTIKNMASHALNEYTFPFHGLIAAEPLLGYFLASERAASMGVIPWRKVVTYCMEVNFRMSEAIAQPFAAPAERPRTIRC